MPAFNTQRLPITQPLNNRTPGAAVTDVDADRLNVMEEPRTDGQQGTYTLKRPGLQVVASFQAGQGQGVTLYNNVLSAVISDNFVTQGPPNSGSSATAWTANANASWTPRTQGGCLVKDDSLFVIGGNLNLGAAGDVWQTRDGTKWTQCTGSAAWGTRAQFACCVLNGMFFLIGGRDYIAATPFNDVWSSPDGVNWTLVTASAPWSARFGHECVVIDNGILMMGGYDPVLGAAKNDAWFSTDGLNWSLVASANPWPVRIGFGFANINGNVYLFGGGNGTGTYYNDCWGSPDGGVTWTLRNGAPFASARGDMGVVVYNNFMWCLGGIDGSLTERAEVYYSPNGTSWFLATPVPGWSGRLGPFCAVFRTPTSVSAGHYQTIWVMGGGFTGAATNDVYRANLDTAIATGVALGPAIAGQPYQFNSYQEGAVLLIKNQSNMWVYSAGTTTLVTDNNYPVETVPGIVVLGGFAYIMDPTGLIMNCALDDPFHWPSLNVLGADYEDDPGVAIAKYKSYLVAFGTYTTQFFYDAGVDVGSPLLPYLAANIKIGCANAATVVSIGDTLFWVGQTNEGRLQVFMMDGLSPSPISDSYIESIIGGFNPIVGAFAQMSGAHQWYILTVSGFGSWAYDLLMKQWYRWSTPIRGANNDYYFPASCKSPLTGSPSFSLGASDGKIYEPYYGIAYDLVAGVGVPYQWTAITQKYDMGNNRTKFWGQLEVIGDRTPVRCLPTIEYSDDDYQTWSEPRPVDLSTSRPVLYRNGSSRRRAYRLKLLDTQAIRLEALEQTWEQGS